ncbi:transporter [Leptospira fletcheri]|uniref:Transporter n=1 Tax=Leptospira fletcheri TaxID=2484981 RepID=A0A4V3JD68_9LEPT|nr:outer membrane protein transport protein [Leptospira fletcheri]TGK08849.1 transporter [Leptospira fletcheri]
MLYAKPRKIFPLFPITLVLLIASQDLISVGIFQPSHNARYGGMGGTNLAIGGSPMDIGTNPANLGLSSKKELEFGVSLPYIRSTYKDQFLDSDPSLAYENSQKYNVLAPLPYLALRVPLSERLTYGVGIYIPGGGNGNVNQLFRATPNGQSFQNWSGLNISGPIGDSKRIKESYSSTFYVAKNTHALSYKIGNLLIGAGLEVIYAHQVAEQKYYDPTGTFQLQGQGFYYRSQNAFSAGGIFGLTYRISDSFKAAYSYQTSARLPLDGDMQVGANPGRTGVSASFFLPERHGLGFSYGKENFRVGVDFLYYNYSSYDTTYKQVLASSWYPTVFGNTNTVPQNIDYHDSWAAGIGGEYESDSWIYRAGARHNAGVLRSDGTNALQAGIMVQDLASLGLGYKSGKWKFDMTFLYYFPLQTKGKPSSDWTLVHSVFSATDVRIQEFRHSLKSDIPAFMFGASRTFD